MAILNVMCVQKRKSILLHGLGFLMALVSSVVLAVNSEQFPLPNSLKPDVNFWLKIYTEITTSEGLIHDNEHLNVIYERLSFAPGTSYKARQKIIKQKKKYYKDTLAYLALNPNKRLAKSRHRKVKALWPKGATSSEFRKAATRLRFQLGQADRFKEGLVRSGRWQPFIKSEFKKLGIPNKLASLPHVESSFRSDARSHAGAAGLWQFTRSTGRRFMRIDHVVDERLDPFLATRAAGLLLKDNHKITGTWPLALTAYNHGAAGMRRAIDATGGTDIAKIVREYKGRTFGFASRNFYNAFVAANDIDENTSKYFGEIKREKRMVVQEVKLPSYYTAQGLMTAFGVKNNIFKSLNPALQPTIWSNNKFVPKGYRLRLPSEPLSDTHSVLIASIPHDEKSTKQKPDVSYKVRRGDSLSKIAKRFKVRTSELVVINGLRSRHKIRIGQVLKLPSKAKMLMPGAGQIAKDAIYYTVRKGDRLSVIAQKADVSEGDLMALNKLKNKNYLYVGQKLRLRRNPQILSVAANEKVYKPIDVLQDISLKADPSNYLVVKGGYITIQSNETLGHFADWLGLKASLLRKMNGLTSKTRLVVGKRLKLDFSRTSTASFEKKRLAFHVKLQSEFFKRFSVVKTKTVVLAAGGSVWLLAQRHNVPMWLLRQYNAAVNFNRLGAGTRLTLPVVTAK
ncbi:MAG: LysM peptidoglycan-binding domain-containing protein [Porticoccaceae bacterium]|nr:LysM peptidoglycan-binding domain-containing protein [Porticoccaceae bacterium]